MNLTSMYARSRQQGVPLSADTRAQMMAARQRLGLSRADLARRIGVVPAHVGALERGVNSPRWDVLHRWAEVLGCRVEVAVRRDVAAAGEAARDQC